MNYYASEHALTKHTKALWENRPEPTVYPLRDVEYQTQRKKPHAPVLRVVRNENKN